MAARLLVGACGFFIVAAGLWAVPGAQSTTSTASAQSDETGKPSMHDARQLLDAGQFDDAIQAYEAMGPRESKSSEAWRLNNLGLAYVQSGKPARAIPLLEKAVKADGKNLIAWNNLGIAYEHSGRDEEAKAAYQKGADGGNARAQANLKILEARLAKEKK